MANGRIFGKWNAAQEVSKGQVDRQKVASVAYGLYEQRGRQDGCDQEDWFKAEEIVRRQRVVTGKR